MARSADIAATPTARAMDRALDDGYAVALVCADGDERIIVAKTA
jgi:hypothetical protein